MSSARTPRERAARLLRWYPRTWRERYGEEFAELLVAATALLALALAAACLAQRTALRTLRLARR